MALLWRRPRRRSVPGFKVKPVDTTAAGDAFNGALAVALAEGRSMVEAVRFANAAGAIAVTRMGAQPTAPTRKEIDKLAQRKAVLSNGAAGPHFGKASTNGRPRRRARASR